MFQSSQVKKKRGFVTFAERTLERKQSKQSSPSGHGRPCRSCSGQIPAKLGHGSEGRVGGNDEGARAHLLVALVGRETTYSGGAMGAGGSAAT